MRNVVLALVVLSLATTSASAQNDDWAKKMFLANGGTLTHDHGNVARGAVLNHKFKMTNIWAVPVEIVNVRAACGCVTATPSKQILQPRETAVLDVNMDARRFTGPKTVQIYVTLGPEYVSTATLQVAAVSRADIVFNPGEVSFGVVAAGQTPTQNIDIEYAGNLDWRVSEAITNGAPLDVKIEELYRRPGQPGQCGYRIKTTLKADAPPGTHKWEVLLKTNDPTSPHVPVLVNATVQGSFTVLPGTLNLGSLKVGEAMTKPVLIRGNKPFRIVSIEGLGDGIQADLPAVAAPLQKLTIKCQPTRPGEFRRQLLIKTDADSEGLVTVTIIGDVVP